MALAYFLCQAMALVCFFQKRKYINKKKEDGIKLLKTNEICVTLWSGKHGNVCYIGYCKEEHREGMNME